LIADVLPRIWERNPDEGRRRLDEIRQLTRGALAEMRTLLLELRPNALVDAEMNELFRHLADAFTGRTRVPVDLEVSFNEETDFDLPADVKICYYRVTQEALNNIAKHAGATRVAIRLYNPGKALALEIRDDGRGFDPESVAADHFGVQIMRERCESIGAEYSLTSLPQAGTSIQVKWSPRTNSSERG
jgi:signal transduction histidine kinase